MSNRWAGVRGWAGVGACSAEGVGDGQNPAKIRFWRLCRDNIRVISRFLKNLYRVCGEFSRKPVKQHIGWFYWLTRGGEVAAGGVRRGGVFGTQRVSAWVGFDFRYTNFVGRLGAGFYLHRVGWGGMVRFARMGFRVVAQVRARSASRV